MLLLCISLSWLSDEYCTIQVLFPWSEDLRSVVLTLQRIWGLKRTCQQLVTVSPSWENCKTSPIQNKVTRQNSIQEI